MYVCVHVRVHVHVCVYVCQLSFKQTNYELIKLGDHDDAFISLLMFSQ